MLSLVLAALLSPALGHPGGLDPQGCHQDQATGERHCHRSTEPESYSARVVRVKDGDTLVVLRDSREVTVRLYGADAPESKQKLGSAATRFSSTAALGKQVWLTIRAKDRYGRTVADVRLPDGRRLGLELVLAGMARWYSRYAPEDKDLAKAEAEARAARRGMWKEDDPQAPWSFRSNARAF
ncbi:MAG: thermonuclease family protein [Elusimicrobia bacterium]|nr:thermonuclease family protein [Elusimicrobiota bacterium]